MKIIGLLGGMSWESTVPYYRIVNETVKARLGGLHSAKVVLLCTNTMHKIADRIESAVRIPLLHIADPTAHAIQAAGFSKVGLLGTRFTMEQDFYKERLARQHGLEVLAPGPDERDVVHRILYEDAVPGARLARIQAPVPRGHGEPGAARRAGPDPGVHGDIAAGRS